MPLKEKLIGLVIIIAGVLPFLTKMKVIPTETIPTFLAPGEVVFQIILIVLGILLVIERRYYRGHYV